MARLAIRATGDNGKRENTTVGNTTVEARVIIKNRHVGTVVVHDWYDKYALYYYPQGTGRTLLHEEKKSETHSA